MSEKFGVPINKMPSDIFNRDSIEKIIKENDDEAQELRNKANKLLDQNMKLRDVLKGFSDQEIEFLIDIFRQAKYHKKSLDMQHEDYHNKLEIDEKPS